MNPYIYSEFDGEEDAADERAAWFVDAERDEREFLRAERRRLARQAADGAVTP